MVSLKHKAFYLFGIVASGLGLTLSQAPYNFWWLSFLSIALLLYLVYQTQTKKAAIFVTCSIGLIHFYTALSWVSNALGKVGLDNMGLKLLSDLGIPVYLSLYWVFLALGVWYIRRYAQRYALVLLPALWVTIELLRGYALFAFPWIPVGNSWIGSLPMAQLASIVGVYGLSFVTVLIGVSMALKYKHLLGVLIILLVLNYGWGSYRLAQNPTTYGQTTVRLVQPNIDQVQKQDPSLTRYNLDLLLLGSKDYDTQADFIIWPESAVRHDVRSNQIFADILKEQVPAKATLLTGGTLITDGKLYNSLIVIQQGAMSDVYNKHNLVPFGEYIPFHDFAPVRWVLNYFGLESGVAASTGHFSRGDGAKTIAVNQSPAFSPLICYEGIFSGSVWHGARPDWLVTVTNDAWYGDSLGPYQHAAMVQMRAIEEGLPMVRVANTGISYITDGVGRVLQEIPLNKTGVINSRLPKPLLETVFSRLINHTIF